MRGLLFTLAMLVLSQETRAEADYCSVCSGSCSQYQPSINCQGTRLVDRLPSQVSQNIEKIIFLDEELTTPHLSSSNFSAYPKSLLKFSVRNCKLSSLEPGTFRHFESIRHLDLTGNRLQLIPDDAFAGVEISYLVLDENPEIHFSVNAFRNSRIQKLSIKRSQLEELPYATFGQLFPSLRSLDLSFNRISLISSRFSADFGKLERLDLDSNLLNCVCSLKWLSYLFASHKSNTKVPLCFEPKAVKNRPISDLKEDAFFCELPRVQKIEVDLQQGSLRCEVSGSPRARAGWYKLSPSGEQRPVGTNFDWFSLYTMSQQPVSKREDLVCVADDVNGQAATKFSLFLPNNLPPSKSTTTTPKQATSQLDDEDQHANVFVKKKFTVMEMAGAIIGTFTVTLALFLCCCCARNTEYSKTCCFPDSRTQKTLRGAGELKYHKASDAAYSSDHLLSIDPRVPGTLQLLQTPMGGNRLFHGVPSSEESNLQQTSSGERRSNLSEQQLSPGAGSLRKRHMVSSPYEHIKGGQNPLMHYPEATYESPNVVAALQQMCLGPLPPIPTEGPPMNEASLMYQAQLQAMLVNTMSRGLPAGGYDLSLLQRQFQQQQMGTNQESGSS
ncbi:SLIT and NTRK-like protein 1 [Cichlidogyrus casuarinus]|uniref:SLIT and NTRK-like protein 1 n=1 Tax=Cichlidogyrus casuarinus TaxID=1844966 RepID=A0ABD2QEM0_9PLAT